MLGGRGMHAALVVVVALALASVQCQVDNLRRATEEMRDLQALQHLVLYGAQPDERIVFVIRAPGESSESWTERCRAYATDRTFRGNQKRETKLELWVWNGTAVEVVTERGPDETEDGWSERHDLAAAVAAREFSYE